MMSSCSLSPKTPVWMLKDARPKSPGIPHFVPSGAPARNTTSNLVNLGLGAWESLSQSIFLAPSTDEDHTKVIRTCPNLGPSVQGSLFPDLIQTPTPQNTRAHRTSRSLKRETKVLVAQLYRILLPHGLEPTRLLCPWNSPGKNTGVGCHSFLQGIFLTQRSNWVSCIAGRFFTI